MLPTGAGGNQLHRLIKSFHHLGWSVIPARGKVAAVRWSAYQQQRPSLSLLESWFNDPTVTSAAVITGPVSNLIILDFDTADSFSDFQQALPDLTNTITVITRRGFHLYYHVPEGQGLVSGKADGIDILYSGRYAILPGSVVNGHTYEITGEHALRSLTETDRNAISGFLRNRRFKPRHQPQGKDRLEPCEIASNRRSVPSGAISDDYPHPLTGLGTLRRLYWSLAPGHGRNNAIFFCACLGRDRGLTEAQVIQALANTHADQAAPANHRPENRRGRYREAVRTIASAFSRPPRSQEGGMFTSGLPNSAREKLLQTDRVGVIRVVEALRLLGVQPGDMFTAGQAVTLLKGIVGRDMVWAVMKSGLIPFPSNSLSPRYAVAADPRLTADKTCVLITSTKSGMRVGTRIFRMPTNTEIAQRLGILDGSLSDPLTLDDLSSSKRTRVALHREFLKRRPGQYPMKLFAVRLGVSARTVQRYHAEDPDFRREIVCDAQEITWFNVDRAMPDMPPHGGWFLMDSNGKKYPCKQAIARMLLADKQKVLMMRRRPNVWSYGPREPDPPEVDADSHPLQAVVGEPYQPFTQSRPVAQPAANRAGEAQPLFRPPERIAAISEPGMRINYQPAIDTAQMERMAKRLRDTINAMSDDQPEHRMSLGSARRLLDKYGEKAVWRAVKIVEHRKNVVKPVGLLSTILRSESVLVLSDHIGG